MKNIIFTALFILVLLDSILLQAQQPLRLHKWKTNNMSEENQKKIEHTFNDLNVSINPFNHQSFNTDIEILNAIIPDFQVNENTGPSGAYQESPAIATDGSSNYVVTWVDERNGVSDIYAQRYSSDGSVLGTNFKVNDDQADAYQESPSISIDNSGNFVIAWDDYRNDSKGDIYAQRYSSDGNVLGVNFKVNNDQGNTIQWFPSISSNGRGNYVIVWGDYRNGNSDIYAQRYSSDGSVLGTNFQVNDDQGDVFQGFPSISTDSSANFVITWIDDRNGDRDIYAQRYSSDGSVLQTNFKVNNQGTEWQQSPSISSDSSGNFVITWVVRRNWNFDIYAQQFSSDGIALGTNFKVNDDQGSAFQGLPAISTDGSGNYVVTWVDERNGDPDIYAQRYSFVGSMLGANFKVNTDQGITVQYSPSVSVDGSGNFVITWEDSRNGDIDFNQDIYAQHYSSDGSVLGTNFKINDDQGSADQFASSISTDGNGDFVITWEDSRNGNSDIYAQCYSTTGAILGTNFKVNDDQGNASQEDPSISTDSGGNFVVTWEDERNGYREDIYAQRYSSNGSPIGTNFKVNDDQGSAFQGLPSISTDSSGNFVIVWQDYRNGDSDIYAQRYSSDGSVLGTNFKVNDQGSEWQSLPSISTDGSGNFVITWVVKCSGTHDIYAQRYSSDGSVLGTNFKVNDDQASADQKFPVISTDGSGNFVIAWNDTRNEHYDIYAQRYSSDGCVLGTNFKVNDDQGSTWTYSPSVSTDGSGNFVIAWWDYRNGDSDIYAQRYSSNGTKMGNNFRVTTISKKSQSSPDVKLWNKRIYNTWTDTRAGGTGSDIWANVLDWENPTGNIDYMSQFPTAFILSQNYPNPFNSSTKISYSIPKSGFVILKIYDMLGNEIQTLENDFQNVGIYSVNFEASDLSSGIYFYKFKVDGYFTETKKMLLLR